VLRSVRSETFIESPEIAAERRKICSPWRKPWDQDNENNAAPGGETES